MELLKDIENYWQGRAEGYSEVNKEELEGANRQNWFAELTRHFGDKNRDEIRILDVGCGPGFFSVILAEQGYHVTAVDYTDAMLEEARKNAASLASKITYMQMDAQALAFDDDQFDVLITRNLTWNLERPREAYKEWHRVLKKGGVLLNYDANWYHYLFNEEKQQEFHRDRSAVEAEGVEDYNIGENFDVMEDIARKVPLSQIQRPDWDLEVLKDLAFAGIETEKDIWKTVWSEAEKVNFQSTPMFLVKGIK